MNWQERYAEFRDLFSEGLDPRFYNIEYLDWLLMSGRAAIWFSEKSSIVCEIKTYPTGARAVSGLIAAGEPKDIAETLIPQAEEWGRANGCSFGMIESRPAWSKLMKSHGYTPFQTALVKEL